MDTPKPLTSTLASHQCTLSPPRTQRDTIAQVRAFREAASLYSQVVMLYMPALGFVAWMGVGVVEAAGEMGSL